MKRFILVFLIAIGIISPSFSQEIGDNYYKKGTANSLAGNYKEAIKDYDKAIKYNPEESLYFFARALAKNELENYEGAIKDYTTFISLKPDNYEG